MEVNMEKLVRVDDSDSTLIVENYRNRLLEDMYSDIPERLIKRLDAINTTLTKLNEKLINKNQFIYEIILDVLDIEDDFSQPFASPKVIKNIRNARKYRVNKLLKDFEQDKLLYDSGSEITELTQITPFSAIRVTSNTTGTDEQELYKQYIGQVDDWKNKITSKRFTAAKELTVEELVKKLTFVSDYPFFYLYKAKDRLTIIKNDIEQFVVLLVSIKKYIQYAMIHPNTLDKKSLFVEGGLHTDNKERTEPVLSSIIQDDGSTLTAVLANMEAGSKTLFKYYIWDDKDSKIINYLSTKIFRQFRPQADSIVSNNFTVSGNLVEICHLIWPNRTSFGPVHYTRAKLLMFNLLAVKFLAKDEAGVDSGYAVFDDVTVDEIEKVYTVSLGNKTAKTLMERQFTTIFMTQYEELENSIARLLYPVLKRDRLFDLVTIGNKKVERNYDIPMLVSMVKTTGNKKDRKNKYLAAFTELAQKGTIIKGVSVRNNGELFVVEWLPITENERLDLVIKDQDTVAGFEQLRLDIDIGN